MPVSLVTTDAFKESLSRLKSTFDTVIYAVPISIPSTIRGPLTDEAGFALSKSAAFITAANFSAAAAFNAGSLAALAIAPVCPVARFYDKL